MNATHPIRWTLAALLALALVAPALANPGGRPHGGDHGGPRFSAPAGHAQSFPSRGSMIGALPRGGVEVNHMNHRYWYHGGSWYSPHGPRWIVVAPPFGVYVPFLPGFYSTFWWGGMPYYYANDVYYVWREQQRAYEVVEPPPGAATAATPAPEDIFMYPRNGQSEEQQGQDRYECHRWAADQTHFDPTRVAGGVEAGDVGSRRAEYFRAMSACLEGRGYSVK
jgi:hypothetical protein